MIWRTLVNAAAVAVATYFVPGISYTGNDSTAKKALTVAVVAVVIGLLNLIMRPILKFITSCLIVLTLGLFVLVINTVLLTLTSVICHHIGVGWHVEGWLSAFFGAVIISFVSMLFGRDHRKNH